MSFWVTRSEPGASRLADALTQANVKAKKCSAIEIVDVSPDAEAAQEPEICIAVSQHAASRYVKSIWASSNAVHIAVGNASRKALLEGAIDAVLPHEPTTEGILALDQLRGAGKVIWILSGVGGREDLEHALVERGHLVAKLEFYERRVSSLKGFTPTDQDVVEVSSITALDAIEAIIESEELKQHITLLLPSERIAKAARDRKFYNTQIASSAEIADVVAAAKKMQSAGRG